MKTETIEIHTADGVARAYEVTPDGDAPHAGVFFFHDGLGVRDAMRAMADRLGAAGYHVLMPSFFHRVGPDVHFDPKVVFSSPDGIAELRKLLAQVTTELAMRDAAVFLAYLASRPDVDASRLGAVGYCMGGRFALLAASQFPERLRAVASIHGGNLVTADGTSAHLGAPHIRARLYFAGAQDDQSFTADNARVLVDALDRAGTRYQLEHYAARHGFAVSDTPVYDPAESERHWQRVLALFAEELAPRA